MYDPIVTLPPDLMVGNDLFLLATETWHLPRSKYRPIRNISNGSGVKVAVLDTGIADHPVLPKPIASKSFISGQSVVDGNAHGTHVAGTVLARDEDIGLAHGADLIIGKVLSNQGSGSSSGIAAGILWAIEQGADVISLSLGGGSRYEPTIDAIKKAYEHGIVVCTAAGNSGFNGTSNTIGYPARAGESEVVAALTEKGVPATFSSGGVQMTIAAPGQNILSTSNTGSGYRLMSGTSMATPFVAGCFALIISLARSRGLPSWTSVQSVNAFIQANATDLLTPGHDPATGYGLFDMTEVIGKLAKDELIYA